MPAVKSGSSLRTLVLTPERIPSFLIPPRSPHLFASPRLPRSSPDRTRLLMDQNDDDAAGASPPAGTHPPGTSPRFLLRLPQPRIRRPRRAAAAAADTDTDLTTRAAMSLSHVEKVTTPYGFRAVLAASPCTRRRESLFHGTKPVTVPDPADLPHPPPSAGSGPSLRPGKALSLQVVRELRRPAAALKALSPAARGASRR
ncbi:C2 calcium-dependent domain-containing protein 4A-like [Parambassis ranga]|uniref:C2 calcium-dependent domain-containing protein 4A-like n=1 Tax=Parambassis ranga TaxID=210632 RepID=A0A6P7K346_9TELE|nr:C2 calcium-dependent domain-containing protein 4A-like [Parambassis ranga]